MSNDLEGWLRYFTISDILQLLSLSGQTGTLTFTQGWNSRRIYFERGRVTYITAATRLPTVGDLLVRSGKLDPAQLRLALDSKEYQSLGIEQTLLEWDWIQPADLKQCQEQQLEETIYSLFLWRNGHFSFETGEAEKSNGIAVDIAAERLVMDGTRRVDEWIAISPYVPSMRMTFKRTDPEGDSSSEEAASSETVKEPETLGPPTDQELKVLSQIDGSKDAITISLSCGLPQFETARCLARLTQLKLARAVPPDRSKIIELFTFVVESVYIKLVMYGYSRLALEFEIEMNRFGRENRLKIHMQAGKITHTDTAAGIETTALIDLYKLFIAIQQNRLSRILDAEIVQGLVEGLYIHLDEEGKTLMQMYEFYPLEGLIGPVNSPHQALRSDPPAPG